MRKWCCMRWELRQLNPFSILRLRKSIMNYISNVTELYWYFNFWIKESITITNCPLQITSDPHIFKNIYNVFSNFRVSEPTNHKKPEFENSCRSHVTSCFLMSWYILQTLTTMIKSVAYASTEDMEKWDFDEIFGVNVSLVLKVSDGLVL